MGTLEANGAARPKIERGVSVAHRQDTKQQKAARAANVSDGLARYQPTDVELARLYGVSVTLINRAKQLLPEAREAVAEGRAHLPQPVRVLTLAKPAAGNGQTIADAVVFDVVRKAGIERVLTIAAAVEQA